MRRGECCCAHCVVMLVCVTLWYSEETANANYKCTFEAIAVILLEYFSGVM